MVVAAFNQPIIEKGTNCRIDLGNLEEVFGFALFALDQEEQVKPEILALAPLPVEGDAITRSVQCVSDF